MLRFQFIDSPRAVKWRLYIAALSAWVTFGGASVAHAGDASCVFRSLSTFSRDQVMAKAQVHDWNAVTQWRATPADIHNIEASCSLAGTEGDVTKGLYAYILETVAGEELSALNVNSGAALITWKAAPPEIKAQYRAWRDANSANRAPSPDSLRAKSWLENQDFVSVAIARTGKKSEILGLLDDYYMLVSVREEAESRF